MKARLNPLSSERVLERIHYRPVDLDWPAIAARLEQLQWRCAIVGPMGTGKTTLLEALPRRFTGRRFRIVHLHEGDRSIPAGALDELSRDEIILLDGAEQLSRLAWMRLKHRMKQGGGVIITTHTPGRLPTLIETKTTPALLAGILRDLLGEAEAGEVDAVALLHKHRGNIRGVLRELYDRFSRSEASLATDRAPMYTDGYR